MKAFLGATVYSIAMHFFLPLHAGAANAAADVSLRVSGRPISLESWESEYVAHAMRRLQESCRQTRSSRLPPTATGRYQYELNVAYPDGTKLSLTDWGGATEPDGLRVFSESSGDTYRHRDCDTSAGIPVTALVEGKLLAQHTPRERRRLFAYEAPSQRLPRLTSYEPNLVGWTFDDNDVNEGYLDALVSLKYPFLHSGFYSEDAAILNTYFAFTGRFSQYIESRDSSPVIGKRFNPKLFFRHWLSQDDYLDFGLAHESNGQSINTEAAYLRAREDFRAEGQDPDFARDYISRGWDYVSLDWRKSWSSAAWPKKSGGLTSYLNLKYFSDNGWLQGEPEEYNDWEGDGVNRRKEYDGISLLTKYEFGPNFCLGDGLGGDAGSPESTTLCLRKVAWQQTTGYDGVFDNNTTRLELTMSLLGVPFILWGQTGYNSDLVDYYRDVNSWGVALELQSYTRYW